ncbi:MAG: helix-turn-helix domain-containing protein [Firmicutes bacterium]|nr:helix-turn-helix domain-containing protein [Bacillota bacterium]
MPTSPFRYPFPLGPDPGLSDVHLCAVPFPGQGLDLVPTPFCEGRVEVNLSDIRDLAKPEGQVCPSCESREIVRYGKPRGVQKYKCKHCRTYFTDLTGTVMHRTRLREKWLRYLELMMEGLPVRQAARLLGISKNTAFAWRHKVISRLAGAYAQTTLSGIVETHQLLLLKCFKGSREGSHRAHAMPGKPGSRQIPFLSPRSDRVYVLFALDRFGNVAAELAPGESRVGFDEIMRDRITPGARVCMERGIGHWPPPGKQSLGLTWTTPSRARGCREDVLSVDPMHHQTNAKRLAVQFRAWLMRFRGVATKYLVRYIAWFWQVSSAAGLVTPVAARRLLLATLSSTGM